MLQINWIVFFLHYSSMEHSTKSNSTKSKTKKEKEGATFVLGKLKIEFNEKKAPPKVKRNRAIENLRTTLMLTIVCILFLITEFPQSILIFFSLLMKDSFYKNVYMPLGDLLDIIALINNSINFLLYCAMSRAFRNTFYKIIVDSWCFKCVKNTACFSRSNKQNFDKRAQQINTNNFSRFAENTVIADYAQTNLVENNSDHSNNNSPKMLEVTRPKVKPIHKSESTFWSYLVVSLSFLKSSHHYKSVSRFLIFLLFCSLG